MLRLAMRARSLKLQPIPQMPAPFIDEDYYYLSQDAIRVDRIISMAAWIKIESELSRWETIR
jgi:hypothetical protein